MKLQVILILWSVLKSLLVFQSLLVCCNQQVYLYWEFVGWFFCWVYFRTDTLNTFLMLLTLLPNIFRKLKVNSFRTLSQTSFTFHIFYVFCIIYILKFLFNAFVFDILANLDFLLCHNFSFLRHIQIPAEHLQWSNFAKIVSNFCPLSIVAQKHHRGCWVGFQVPFCVLFIFNQSVFKFLHEFSPFLYVLL